MHQILVYADSLTWGIVPNTRQRLAFDERWPGVMEGELLRIGHAVRVIEDALNGRRTVWEDPYKPGRNGLQGLEQRVEINSPLSLVMLMLGTNDFQSMHDHRANHAAQGMVALIQAVRRAPIEPGMPVPEIAVIAPPPIRTPKGALAWKFEGSDAKCRGLSDAYAAVAAEHHCRFFDSATVTKSSDVDGIHLDAPQHRVLGLALAPVVAGWLQSPSSLMAT